MKTVGSGLTAHLAGEVTTLATLWKVTRTDATVFGFTDADSDIVYSGVTYKASTGHSPSAIKTTGDLSVDNAEIVSVLDSATLTEQDIAAGKWDYAAIELMMVNYANLSHGALLLRKGTLGQIKVGRGQFTAELRGISQALQQTMGRIVKPACDADLGDARCGIALASYTATTSVTGVTSASVFAATALTAADGYYDFGLVTWMGGSNAGLKMEVKTFLHTGGAVALQMAMPYAIQVGDTFTISAGCDKSRDTCRTKFSNVINFRSFPDLPGQDRVLQTP